MTMIAKFKGNCNKCGQEISAGTDGAGCVLLCEDSTQIGYFRTDATWPDEAREQTDMQHYIYGLKL